MLLTISLMAILILLLGVVYVMETSGRPKNQVRQIRLFMLVPAITWACCFIPLLALWINSRISVGVVLVATALLAILLHLLKTYIRRNARSKGWLELTAGCVEVAPKSIVLVLTAVEPRYGDTEPEPAVDGMFIEGDEYTPNNYKRYGTVTLQHGDRIRLRRSPARSRGGHVIIHNWHGIPVMGSLTRLFKVERQLNVRLPPRESGW